MGLAIDQELLKFNTTFGKFTTNPEIKAASDFLNTHLNSLKTDLMAQATGKNTVEFLENKMKIWSTTRKFELIKEGQRKGVWDFAVTYVAPEKKE
jgi:hypothetical protein